MHTRYFFLCRMHEGMIVSMIERTDVSLVRERLLPVVMDAAAKAKGEL
jgi:hypothetical protein